MSEFITTLVAATIAALAATIGLIIAKENKTSEFRQAWINDLRSALISLNALMSAIYLKAKNASVSGKTNCTNFDNETCEYHRLLSEINLRINYRNKSCSERSLSNSITNLKESAFKAGGDFFALQVDFTEKSSAILKEEWVRVKRGEMAYVTLKQLCYVFSFLLISFVSIYFFYRLYLWI